MRRIVLSGLLAAGYSGVPRYAARLITAMDEVAPRFPDLEVLLVTTPAGDARTDPSNIAVRALRRPRADWGPARLVYEQLEAIRAGRADLVHYFDMIGPLLAPRIAFTATMHDAKVMRFPDSFSRAQRAYKRRLMPWVARRASAIVAISEVARREALAHLGADPARVRVVHSGPGLADGAPPAPRGPRMNRRYFLYVGQMSTTKNLPFLVEAFERAEVDAELVLAGRPAIGYPEVLRAIARSPARQRIRLVDDADDERLGDLYDGAIALVVPSTYEGFGFTPLEAMAKGCPVIASDIPAHREVAGDGALLRPLDVPAWSASIRWAATDPHGLDDLRRRGRARVGRFSWEQTALGVFAVIGSVA
jgi:glycosyltransferase involved in cell wall biosynthesis